MVVLLGRYACSAFETLLQSTCASSEPKPIRGRCSSLVYVVFTLLCDPYLAAEVRLLQQRIGIHSGQDTIKIDESAEPSMDEYMQAMIASMHATMYPSWMYEI